MDEFKIGTRVSLKLSRSNEMIVQKILPDNQIKCIWRDEKHITYKEVFHKDMLKILPPRRPGFVGGIVEVILFSYE